MADENQKSTGFIHYTEISDFDDAMAIIAAGMITPAHMNCWPPSTVLTPERLAAQEEENKRMRALLDKIKLENSDE